MSKVVFLVVWSFAFYLLTCMAAGGIAGATAGGHCHSYEEARLAGARAGAKIVNDNWSYFAVGSIVVATVGTSLGILPGTKD
jgi:hypothetical protein